jgi:hypothetical protein
MFCAPGLVFGGTESVGSHFHFLRARTYFRRYRGCRLPFSCFVLPNSFSAVPTASGLVFMFCAPGHVFCGAKGVRSRIHVLCSRTRFRWCGRRRVLFSCFALPDSFSADPAALGPFFMFCEPVLIFGGIEGVRSRFHVLCSWTHFRWYRGRRVPFSCFVLPDMFSAVRRTSGSVFTFCSPGHVFGCAEGVGSCFHILRS